MSFLYSLGLFFKVKIQNENILGGLQNFNKKNLVCLIFLIFFGKQ